MIKSVNMLIEMLIDYTAPDGCALTLCPRGKCAAAVPERMALCIGLSRLAPSCQRLDTHAMGHSVRTKTAILTRPRRLGGDMEATLAKGAHLCLIDVIQVPSPTGVKLAPSCAERPRFLEK